MKYYTEKINERNPKMQKKYKGLTDEEAIISEKTNGRNVLTEKKGTSFFKKLLNNFGDPIIKILILALIVTVLLPGGDGSVFETVGIAAAILISTLVSTLSEHGSEKAFRRMQTDARQQKCTVIRNGTHTVLPIENVVVGDTVCLFSGEKIPADGYIIDGGILCDESALTGESREIEKSACLKKETDKAPEGSRVFRGSTVTAGECVMVVTAVGDGTYYGNMAFEVQSDSGKSPLKEKLSVLAKTLSRFGYFCAVCVAIAYLINAFFLSPSFSFTFKNVFTETVHALTLAVSVVVVAVPEGLPMMITVVLSSNMLRMQKDHVQVRKPVGIETAGGINILFTDKTGTLTFGTPSAAGYVMGDGSTARRSSDLSKSIRFLLGTAAVTTSDCIIEDPLSKEECRILGGNATDRAVLSGYLSAGEYPKGPSSVSKLSFDSSIKLAAATVDLTRVPDTERFCSEKQLTFIKGAPEMLLDKCVSFYAPDGTVKRIDKKPLFRELDKMTSKGTRVIAVVTSSATAETVRTLSESVRNSEKTDLSPLFNNVSFVCFIAIKDSLRHEAPKAIKTLKEAGIQVVMITGDGISTARSVAREAGILDPDGIAIESSELNKMSDTEIARILPSLRVVARALPTDKSRLVRIAKEQDLITGMTGDGINDAPALKLSDVGFAMGSGTEVAKEAGDIIITDNNIASIVKAVLYGRTIFRSIRKFIVFQLTMNLSAVGISIIGPFINFETPVTVMQMLWINIIMDTLAALAFAGESPRRFFMKEPPVPKSEQVLSGDMITKIFVMGIYTVMLCLFFLQSEWVRVLFGGFTDSLPFLSGFFALFVFSGLFGAFNARASRLNLFSGLLQNPIFITVISLVFSVQMALIYYGGETFRSAPLTLVQLQAVLLLSFTVIPAGRLLELIMKAGRKTLTVKSGEPSALTSNFFVVRK